jgi:dTMP kinase
LRGLFVSLEGPDGSGKSTQAGLIFQYLKKRQIPAILTREPGGSSVAEKLRQVLLSEKHHGLHDKAEVLLFEASRAQHLRDTITPALEAGKVVLCDRYVDSTLAYQGHGRGLDTKALVWLNNFASEGLKPDLTLLFDMPERDGLKRAIQAKDQKGDRMEALGPEFHARVRQGFLSLAKAAPRRIKVIPVIGKGPQEILSEGLGFLEPLLAKHGF